MEIKEFDMFFSVKVPMKIGGKPFRTCVCYDLTEALRTTVEKLVKEDKAVIYAEQRFFCNGKLVDAKLVKKEPAQAEEKPKKVKKAKTVPVKDTEELAEEAEIVPIEEITDETEGF